MTKEAEAVRRLVVEADLRLDLGGRPARLTGSGSELTLQLADPADTLTQVRAALLPRAAPRLTPRRLGQLAERLRAAGLRLTVRGPRGALLVLGQRGSLPVRLLTRSRYVALGRPRVLAPTLARLLLRRRGGPG